MKENKTRSGMLLMALCSMLWSIGGLFIKLVPWNPVVIAGLRSLIAIFIFLGYMRLLHYHIRVNRRTLLCGLMLVGTMIFFVCANKFTTSANAIILQSTSPIHIMLLSTLLLGSRYSRSDYLVVVICLAGTSLFFFDQLTPGGLMGNIFALASGLTMGAMFVLSSALPDEESSMSALLLGHLGTALVGICCLPFFPITLEPMAVGCMLVLGVFQLGIPYVLYGMASHRCPPLYCSLIGMLEPLFNPLWVFLVMGEKPGAFALTGGIIVLVTVALWCVAGAKAAAQQQAQG